MEDIMIEFYKKKQKIIEELNLEEVKLQRESINRNIAERDQIRVDKQAAEDRGCGKIQVNTPKGIEVVPVDDLVNGTVEFWVDTTDGTNNIVHIDDKTKAVDLGPFDPNEMNVEQWQKKESEDWKLETDPKKIIPVPEIEEAIKVSQDIGDALEEVDDNIVLLQKIEAKYQGAIAEYRGTVNKNAVWRGNITKGFKDFCLEVLGITIEVD